MVSGAKTSTGNPTVSPPKPALLTPGDGVLFQPIDPDTFMSIRDAVENGGHQIEGTPIEV